MEEKLSAAEIAAEAERAAAALHEFVRSTLAYPETPAGWSPDRACHYVIFGAHVDPDLGANYVPVDEPVTPYRRRKIGRRKSKVRALERWLQEAFMAGVEPEQLKRELERRQKHPAIAFAASPDELQPLLAHAMANDLLAPDSGYIGDIYYGVSPGGLVLFGWGEQHPCEGGIADRYYYSPK